jgi:hypothetical protein
MGEKNKMRRVKVDPILVGEKVYVPFGNTRRVARIVEDRGAIGRGGRRLLREIISRSLVRRVPCVARLRVYCLGGFDRKESS